jgi:membrane protein implicated in regulation of membrane protease activity
MGGLLLELTYWNWWLLGLVLIIVEMLVPGTFILWMGLAAVGLGFIVLLFPALSWQLQGVLFALLTVASMVTWWLYFKKHPSYSSNPYLNRRGYQYVGRMFILDTPIVNGQGRLRVDDSFWKISGTDCPAGSWVRVTGVEGTTLQVEIKNAVSLPH